DTDSSYADTLTTATCYQYQVVVQNGARGNTTYTTGNILKVDSSGPSGGSITYSNANLTTTSTAISWSNASDAQSNINASHLERGVATYSGGTCGAYTYSGIVANDTDSSYTDSSLSSGYCYMYRVVNMNGAGGNNSPITSSNEVRVDTTAPAVSITGPGAGTWQTADFTPTGTDSDGESGLRTCYYAVEENRDGVWTEAVNSTRACGSVPQVTVSTGGTCHAEGSNNCTLKLWARNWHNVNSTFPTRNVSIDYMTPIVGTPTFGNGSDINIEASQWANITVTINDYSLKTGGCPGNNATCGVVVSIEGYNGGANVTMTCVGSNPNYTCYKAYMPTVTDSNTTYTIWANDTAPTGTSVRYAFSQASLRTIIRKPVLVNLTNHLTGLPLDPWKTVYAGELCNWFDESGPRPNTVVNWSRTDKQWDSATTCLCGLSNCGGAARNFTVMPGYGYYVSGSSTYTMTLTGGNFTTVSHNLNTTPTVANSKGWNLVSITTNRTSSQLCSDAGSPASRVAWYNASTSAYDTWVCTGSGDTFTARKGESFWMNVTSNTTWAQNGD
ncbi:MAG: hypothetical protein HY558_03485, partial [Euryarchaeota archaeon]|nr:hypothetical protein [Euryarchaeota archaeon]